MARAFLRASKRAVLTGVRTAVIGGGAFTGSRVPHFSAPGFHGSGGLESAGFSGKFSGKYSKYFSKKGGGIEGLRTGHYRSNPQFRGGSYVVFNAVVTAGGGGGGAQSGGRWTWQGSTSNRGGGTAGGGGGGTAGGGGGGGGCSKC